MSIGLLVDVEPRQWIIDTKMKVKYRVFDPITSELLPGALVVGYGGNLKILGQTDHNGEYTTDIEHKMPGFTSHMFLLPQRGVELRELPPGRQMVDGLCENGTTTVREMTALPDEIPLGKELRFKIAVKNDWTDLVMTNRTPILRMSEKSIDFDVPEDCTELHLRLNWTGLSNSFKFSWTSPDNRIEEAEPQRLLQRCDLGEYTISPLCLQPEDDGLIRNPKPGKWRMSINSSGVRSNNSLITTEVFAKHESPSPLKGMRFRIHGCGINSEYVTDKTGAVNIREIPKEKGIITITYGKDHLVYQNQHFITVK